MPESNDYLDIFSECLKTLDHILDLIDGAQLTPEQEELKIIKNKDDFDDFILAKKSLSNNELKRSKE